MSCSTRAPDQAYEPRSDLHEHAFFYRALDPRASSSGQLLRRRPHAPTEAARQQQLEFSAGTFLLEFAYNLLWPLLLPMGLMVEGYGGMAARGMVLHGASAGSAGQVVLHALVAVTLTMPLLCKFALGVCPSLGPVELLSTFSIVVLHRACVGTKYAYLNPEERQCLREQGFAAAQIFEMQLSGWAWQNTSNVLLHARKAEARLGLRADRVHFVGTAGVLPPQLPLLRKEREVREASGRLSGLAAGVAGEGAALPKPPPASSGGQDEPGERPSVLRVALGVLDASLERRRVDKVRPAPPTEHALPGLALSACLVVIPCVVRASKGLPAAGGSSVELACFVLNAFNQLLFGQATFSFLGIARDDYDRRARQLKTLAALLHPLGAHRLGGLTVPLDAPANTRAFVALLRLLRETGRVFLLRVALFAYGFLLLFALRCGYIVYSAVSVFFFDLPLDLTAVLATSLEAIGFVLYFSSIVVAVGRCNRALARITEMLLLARLELPLYQEEQEAPQRPRGAGTASTPAATAAAGAAAEGAAAAGAAWDVAVGGGAPRLHEGRAAIEHAISLLEHARLHDPYEFCGMGSELQFGRLLLTICTASLSLGAAWFISASTAPSLVVEQYVEAD